MRKHFIFLIKIIQEWKYCIFCIPIAIFIFACGEETDENAFYNHGSSESASAVFSIIWPDSGNDQLRKRSTQALSDNCSEFGIETVEAKIRDENDVLIASSKSYPCISGSGEVNDIPPGTNRKFEVIAKDADGYIILKGEKTGQSFEAGVTTEVGFIELKLFIDGVWRTLSNREWDGCEYETMKFPYPVISGGGMLECYMKIDNNTFEIFMKTSGIPEIYTSVIPNGIFYCTDVERRGGGRITYTDNEINESCQLVGNHLILKLNIDNYIIESEYEKADESEIDGAVEHCDPFFTEKTEWYEDKDDDGYGDMNDLNPLFSYYSFCGYASNNTDCDDNNKNIHPGALEIPDNEIDEDCNGSY